MKIFDCITYYDEELLFDIRCHYLDSFVDYFVVVEAKFTHSGEPKKLNFDINKFPKFKSKIIYHIIENEPENIKNINSNNDTNDNLSIKRLNSLKRIEQSYDETMKAVRKYYQPDDYYMLSDSDEIPKIEKKNFVNNKNKIIVFKQKFFYYKFNLFYDLLPWFGTRACKFRNLRSPTWLRNSKYKKYPFWRLDTFFSNTKFINLNIIDDGGWHFSNLKTLDKIIEKLNSSGHHDEYVRDIENISIIRKMIEKKQVYYNHFADQKETNKIRETGYDLKKIELNLLPKYIQDNKEKLSKFIEI